MRVPRDALCYVSVQESLMKKKLVASLLLAGLLATAAQAAPAPLTAQQQTFRAIYQQLVEINTTPVSYTHLTLPTILLV